MKIARLTGWILVAIIAVGLVAASAATAEPEFRSSGGLPTAFTGTSGTIRFSGVAGSGDVLECRKDNTTGAITNATLAGNVVVHFLECEGKEGSGSKCPVMSTGAPTVNLIQTTTLHGVLGLALTSAGATRPGVLLLPISGKRFYTLLSGPTDCVVEAATTGLIAGEVEPVGVLSTTGKLVFVPHSIKGFHLTTGGFVTPKLVSFGGNAVIVEATESLTFAAKVEVT